MKGVFFGVVLFLLLLPVSVSAVDYYVDTQSIGGTCSDSNLGTLTQPFCTIGQANSVVQPGDRVYIREGTYTGNSNTIWPDSTGTQGNYITYTNYNGEEVNLEGMVNGVVLIDKHYLIIDGFKIRNTRSYWVHCRSTNCSYNIIRNCDFFNITTPEFNGMYFGYGNAHHNRIINNTLRTDCYPNDLIKMWQGANYNLVENNTLLGGAHGGIVLIGRGTENSHNIIRNNYVRNHLHTGINVYANADENLVEGNIIVDSGEVCDDNGCSANTCGSSGDRSLARPWHPGIQLGTSNSIIRNNVLINNGLSIDLHTSAESLSSNNRIYHNTMNQNYYGLYSNTQSDMYDNVFKNNIAYNNSILEIRRTVAGTSTDDYYINNDILGSGIDVYPPGTTSLSYLETNYPSLWHDNREENPQFVSEAGRNLRLQEGSQMIDNGDWLTTTTSSGSGTNIPVQDARYFMDGWGLIEGDEIQLESQTTTARITNVDYNNNILTVNTSLTWSAGQGVSLVYEGSGPDIGAYEHPGTGNTWYVRPYGGSYGNEDGSNYANAWDGLNNVVWGTGGVQAGDNLYVCGFHLRTRTGGSAWEVFSPQISGADNSRITIRGDCPGDQGIIWGAGIMAHEPWVNEGGGVWSITAVGTPGSEWYFEDITNDAWTVLKQTQSLNDCRATPGSFYSPDYAPGSKLYVHTSNNQDPTNRIAANRLGYHLIMNDKHYITWLNLKFYSIYRWVEAGATNYGFLTHMRWENCTIWYGESIHFLFRNGNHHLEFIDCDIGYARNGIGFAEYPIGSGSMGDGSEPRDSVIRGCTFHHIGLPYGDPDAHAVSGQGSRNILIENNEMYLVGSGVTFYCNNENQAIRNITVRYNWIHDTHSNCETNDPTRCANSRGIEFNTGRAQGPGTSADVYGNIVGPNISSVCYRYFWTEEGKFYNNVAYDCGTSFYIHHSLSPVNARIRNSISMNPQSYHIRFSSNNYSSVTSLDSDYNIFYPVDQDNFFIYVPEERLTDVSFSEWQSLSIPGYTFDPNSLGVNPLFIDPQNGNFHLQPNSPAIDNGTFVGLTLDFEGNPIPQGSAPDIGAYEYPSGVTYPPGDLNYDGYVDIIDLGIIAINFGKKSGFDPRADTIQNNEIDVYDLVFVGSKFS